MVLRPELGLETVDRQLAIVGSRGYGKQRRIGILGEVRLCQWPDETTSFRARPCSIMEITEHCLGQFGGSCSEVSVTI
jgi:hypothetical protein